MGWDGNPVRWRGRASYQLPSDLWHYQEIIRACRPAWVIETGTGEGGTAAFLQDVCDLEGGGTVVGVGEDSVGRAAEVIRALGGGPAMIILDSDVYSAAHVLAELRAYAPRVTPGQYLIVCHTDRPDWGSAPALAEYLAGHPGEFAAVPGPTPTLNPGGYLRRLK